MQKEKDILISEFENEMIDYFPNWNIIIEKNNVTTKTFGQRLKKLRESRGLTQKEIGDQLSYKKQNISKIEKGKNKKIPVNKLDFISDQLSVSVAYLLGLEEDDSLHYDKRHYYFLQCPNKKYEPVKKDVFLKPLVYPMETWGIPMDNMMNTVIEGLKTDYELIAFLYFIFTAKKEKQKKIRDIINAIKKIL